MSLDDAIKTAVGEQYPNGKPATKFAIMYGREEKKSQRARWSDHFALQLKTAGFTVITDKEYNDLTWGAKPKPGLVVSEFRFHPDRLWRMDYAVVATKIHIEIEGGIWMPKKGAHSRPMNIQRDIEKQNASVMLGWSPLRFSPIEIKAGISIDLTARLNTILLSSKTT